MKINAKPMPNAVLTWTVLPKNMSRSSTRSLPLNPRIWSLPCISAAAISVPPGFLPADMGPLPRPSLRTVLSMDSFSNTIRIGQGTSIRSTISRTKRLFWALLPQNRQTLKIRKPSKDGSRKQAPWFPWISWPLARNAALLPRKKAISSRKKTSGRSSPLSAALPVKSGPMPIEFRLS